MNVVRKETGEGGCRGVRRDAVGVAAARTRAEQELQRIGTPEADIGRLADSALDGWRIEQAQQAAEQGNRQAQELRDHFRSRPRRASTRRRL